MDTPKSTSTGGKGNGYWEGGAGNLIGGLGNDTPRRMVFRFPDKPLFRKLVSVKTAAYCLAV